MGKITGAPLPSLRKSAWSVPPLGRAAAPAAETVFTPPPAVVAPPPVTPEPVRPTPRPAPAAEVLSLDPDPVPVPVLEPVDDLFRFRCPHCGRKVKARHGDAGKKCRCTKCGSGFRIPDPSAALA